MMFFNKTINIGGVFLLERIDHFFMFKLCRNHPTLVDKDKAAVAVEFVVEINHDPCKMLVAAVLDIKLVKDRIGIDFMELVGGILELLFEFNELLEFLANQE